jgi:NADPH:quinone reductase-like Zn-dependent oxidoreductase
VLIAGVNPFDWKFCQGYLASYMPASFPQRLGLDFAGVVDQVGSDVSVYLRSIGVTPVRYGDGLVERALLVAPRGVDAALDMAGVDALPASLKLVSDKSRVVTIADMAAAGLGVRYVIGDQNASRLACLARLAVELPRVMPVTVVPFAEAAVAYAAAGSGHVRDKFVLQIGEQSGGA